MWCGCIDSLIQCLHSKNLHSCQHVIIAGKDSARLQCVIDLYTPTCSAKETLPTCTSLQFNPAPCSPFLYTTTQQSHHNNHNETSIYKFTTAASQIQFTTIELLISCFIVLHPSLNNNNPVQAITMLLSAFKKA